MAEQITYPAPQQAKAGTTLFRVVEFEMSKKKGVIRALFEGDNGTEVVAFWRDSDGENATALMVSLNKVNLATKSMERRIIERAQADGKLPAGGTITGTAD